jgi:cytoskeleton protein RodZ
MAFLQRINSSLGRPGPEPDAPASPGVHSAGEDLRRQREAFKLDLEAVEAALKIKCRYLAAIEDGRTDLLPGPAYAAGFVRAYSDYLGLDSAEILRRFKLEGAGLDAKPDLAFLVPLGERSAPGRGMVLTGLIAAICIYTIWYFWTAAERVVPERVADVPAALLSHEPAAAKSPPDAVVSMSAAGPAAGASPNQPKPPSAPGQDQPADVVPASTPPAASIRPAPEQPKAGAKAEAPPSSVSATGGWPLPASRTASESGQEPAPSASAVPVTVAAASPPEAVAGATARSAGAAATAPVNPPTAMPDEAVPASVAATPVAAEVAAANPPAPANPMEAFAAPPHTDHPSRVLGAADAPSRIVVRATADSWVQIRDATRTVLFTGVLKAGDTYRVPDRPGLVMRAGNAGGLDVLIDGKPAPPLGRKGAVRNVALDPQALMSVEPVRD